MKLVQNQTYRAELDLPFFVSKATAKEHLEQAGFANVVVYESGGKTYAQGTWPGLARDVEMPHQVVKVWLV